ncbi:hypothetical protein ACHAXR_005864 [Thalassiosira sp. AJA248-18]
MSTLTPSERESRNRLKSEIKFQRKVKKLETRIKHAISRNDPLVEKSSREELEDLLASAGHSQRAKQLPSLCELRPPDDPQRQAALDEVLVILRSLLSSIDDDEKEKIRQDKILQTQKAKQLLRNMTKGTQSKSMFQDKTALRGYVRQKFHSRAALLIESLRKLSPTSLEAATSSLDSHLDSQQQQEHARQKETMNICWDKLGNIEKICSLGCGPGNDAVGLTAFIRNCFNHNDGTDESMKQIKDIYMLDYAIEEWKDAILDNLKPIMAPEYVANVTCKCCDITHPLANDGIEQIAQDSDIFLTSYLLTETRNQWDQFFVQLVGLAKLGALFYFSEPVPWQLNRLIRMSSPEFSSDASPGVDCSPLYRLRFVWIDSSMHFPDLQKLDRRAGGPAVLLAIKI